MNYQPLNKNLGVSENGGTPKSSISIGISITNHPFWGTPIFGNTHLYVGCILEDRSTGRNEPYQRQTNILLIDGSEIRLTIWSFCIKTL